MGERKEKKKKKITYNWNVVYYNIWMCNFRRKNQIIIYNYLCKWAKVGTFINNSSNLIIFWNKWIQMSTNVMKLKNMKIVNTTLFFPRMDFNNGKKTNVNKMTSLKTNFHTFVKACPNFCSVFWQPLLGTRTQQGSFEMNEIKVCFPNGKG